MKKRPDYRRPIKRLPIVTLLASASVLGAVLPLQALAQDSQEPSVEKAQQAQDTQTPQTSQKAQKAQKTQKSQKSQQAQKNQKTQKTQKTQKSQKTKKTQKALKPEEPELLEPFRPSQMAQLTAAAESVAQPPQSSVNGSAQPSSQTVSRPVSQPAARPAVRPAQAPPLKLTAQARQTLQAQAAQAQQAQQARLSSTVADMKSLIEQGRFADAFNLGLKNESLAGDPVYDYYFGIAAVDSGRASLGVLALERVLLSNPGNDLARIELARGYFILQDFERAREEFQILAAKDVPPTVRASINKYLAAIRERDPEFRKVTKGYLEWAVGYNSNVNSSTNQEVLFPLLGQSLPPVLIKPEEAKASPLSQVVVGASIAAPVVPGLKYSLGIDVSQRSHASVDNFDQTTGGANAGLEYGSDFGIYRLGTFVQQARLDYRKLRDTYGVLMEFVRPINKETSVRAGLGFAQLRYDGDAVNRDSDLPTFAAGYNVLLGGEWRYLLDLSFNVGRESNQRNRPDYTRNILGGRAGLGFQPGPRWQGNWTYAYTKSSYSGADPFGVPAGTIRGDELHNLEFGLQYQLTKGWSARGELLFNKNFSNLVLYEYDQRIGFFKMRYEWK